MNTKSSKLIPLQLFSIYLVLHSWREATATHQHIHYMSLKLLMLFVNFHNKISSWSFFPPTNCDSILSKCQMYMVKSEISESNFPKKVEWKECYLKENGISKGRWVEKLNPPRKSISFAKHYCYCSYSDKNPFGMPCYIVYLIYRRRSDLHQYHFSLC